MLTVNLSLRSYFILEHGFWYSFLYEIYTEALWRQLCGCIRVTWFHPFSCWFRYLQSGGRSTCSHCA
jgi:hypothetical protein